ncbi:ATP-binding protein [Streptomyces sp. NPDC018352]|uniref:ATP-binding protein n=1 Tax=Streptomyces sp. NPDC018352 TaxID=3157194 RepID=UPI0033F776F8
MSVEGEERALSSGTDLTAYRIVQEALTNVTKHAGSATASVRLRYTRRLLSLTITDDGHEPRTAGEPGYGLIGMRERALSAGGWLAAGHRASGGFEVATELPLETLETAEPDSRQGGPDSHQDDEERTAR